MAIVEVHTEEELDTILTQSETDVVIVKLGAEWCRPCQLLQPHLELLASELQEKQRGGRFVTVEKTEDTEPIFEKYEITKLPTVLLVVNGEVKQTLARPDPDTLRTQVFTLTPPPPLVLDEDF